MDQNSPLVEINHLGAIRQIDPAAGPGDTL
jgi:hypothetical protein